MPSFALFLDWHGERAVLPRLNIALIITALITALILLLDRPDTAFPWAPPWPNVLVHPPITNFCTAEIKRPSPPAPGISHRPCKLQKTATALHCTQASKQASIFPLHANPAKLTPTALCPGISWRGCSPWSFIFHLLLRCHRSICELATQAGSLWRRCSCAPLSLSSLLSSRLLLPFRPPPTTVSLRLSPSRRHRETRADTGTDSDADTDTDDALS